jgi:hypothetical protein
MNAAWQPACRRCHAANQGYPVIECIRMRSCSSRLCNCPLLCFQVRDEKRVFYRYWREKSLRIFLSAKRFRLLAPFTGSTVRDASTPPLFTANETTKLWSYVRDTLQLQLEAIPLRTLESGELLRLDYPSMTTAVLWLFPRSAWQIEQLWTREYTAWLATERHRMNWQLWDWHPDWEVCRSLVNVLRRESV